MKPQIIFVPVDELKPYANNAKLHPKKQIQQIANSIKQFGFINAIVIDSKNEIIAGHGRLEAAKLLGLNEVPVISVEHLTKAEIKAYRLADNQLTMNSGYDYDLLKIELLELTMQNEFEIDYVGFETAEVDIIMDGDADIADDPADAIPEIDEAAKPVTKLGDIYQLDKHLIICGNSIESETYQKLMQDKLATTILTDPPYNVKVDGHICGSGKTKHREFAMASGEMSEDEFFKFLAAFITLCTKFSKDGSLHYIFIDWRGLNTLLNAGDESYTELKNICVWNKNNGGMGSLYRSKHEMVAVFKHGTKPHINNIELGKHGRYRTNIWDYDRNQKHLQLHPTVKPVAMLIDAIKDCTKRGDIILDPFAGSGSTLIACEKSQRVARCIELDPIYCDTIIRRWQDLTGQDAVHLESGKTFNQLAQQGE